MSRNSQKNFTQYIHEFTDKNGQNRYAVAEWNEQTAEYIRPLDKRSAELTGCYAEFSKDPQYFGGYKTRRQALRRARYLFGDNIVS